MRKLFVLPVLMLATAGFAQDKGKLPTAIPVTDTARPAPPKKVGIQDRVKSARKVDGLFTVYQDTATGSVQLYVKKNQLGKEYIYQSYSLNGPTSLFLHRNIQRTNLAFRIHKAFDRLEFSIVNNNFYYDKNNAVSRSAGADVAEAIFLSEKVGGEDENGYLISADGLFLSEKLDPIKPVMSPGMPPGALFNLGGLNPMKSKYNSIKSYPLNTNILVDLAYDNPMPFNPGGKDITDARYVRVSMQHSLIEMPENDYRPRRDDPRVGFFMSEVNDQTSISATPFRDVIHRWHLKKKDPTAALSEPVEPIVWWIENTTPVEFRPIVMEAGNKWNEAFEKAGFKNAIVMKIQPDDADWDAGDIRYNVIKWVSSPYPPYGAIGMHAINPKTGQTIAGDIVIEWASGSGVPIMDELYGGPALTHAHERRQQSMNNLVGSEANCTLSGELREQFVNGLTVLESGDAAEPEVKEMHKQFLYYLIMHEMGHTLGLSHNMRSSQMLKPAELNNKELTRKIGLMGSVMDYPAANIAADKTKQGDYFTTKAGPYDMWAIEYGYTPLSEIEEEAALSKIISRSTEPQLAFGNDADDMRAPGKGIDPRVNLFDMSSDAIGFAEEQFKLIKGVMVKLKDKYSKPGKSYAEMRSRYNILNNQRFNMASTVSRFVGGVYIDRGFVGQSTARPLAPVPLATQKKAMEVLNKYVFAPDAFSADEQVYPYLQLQRRGFNFFSGTEDPKLASGYTGMQSFGALSHILHPATLQRITNTRLYGNQYSVAEVMGDLTKGIFSADLQGKVNVHRQYLQTQFVKNIAYIVGQQMGMPYDDVSKAAALYTLKKIKGLLATAVSPDEETKAHRSNIVFLIDNAITVK